MENTESKEKINVRGTIRSLEVGDCVTIQDYLKEEVVPSYVRSVTTQIKTDTGRDFTVSAVNGDITVTRLK